jgi:HEAT repeat protein
MISECEILEIVNDADRLGLLADQFRQGRDIGDLMVLLNSKNEEIVRIGVWIAGEVKVDPANAQPLIVRLHQLITHDDPSIRFHAIGALFPYLDLADPAANEMLVRLSRDPNDGVRAIAEAALKRTQQK